MNQQTTRLLALMMVDTLVIVVVAYLGFIAETIDLTTTIILIVGLGLITTPLYFKIAQGNDETNDD